MASKRFEIDMGLNASDVAKGAKDAEKAMALLEDAVEDAATGGAKDVDKLEDALKDVQRQAKRTRDDLDDVGDKARDAGNDGADGFRKLGDAGEEVSGELKQNLGETFSSFRGDLEDLPQLAQDVFGGLAGSVDSLTWSLGLAGAAGAIGLIVAGFQAAQEEGEKSAERAADWADAYIEAGGRALSFDQQAAKVRAILTDPEMYKTATKNAELWGLSVEDAVAAMAGSVSAIDEAQAGIDRMRAGADELAASGATVTDEFGNITTAGSDLAGMAINGQIALDQLKGEMDRGAESAGVMSRWLIDAARATEGATEAVDEFGDTIISLPDGHKVYIDAETGQATENVDAIEQKIYGVPTNKTVWFTADTSGVDREIRRISNTTLKIGTKVVTSGDGWQ